MQHTQHFTCAGTVPVRRRICTYFGGGTSYWQILLSQWRYAVQPRRQLILWKCQKIPNCYATDEFLKLKMHQNLNLFSARAPPRTPLGELRRSPDPLVGWGRGHPLPIPPLDASGASINSSASSSSINQTLNSEHIQQSSTQIQCKLFAYSTVTTWQTSITTGQFYHSSLRLLPRNYLLAIAETKDFRCRTPILSLNHNV